VIVAESHRGRRLLGRLDRGADLLPALAELAASRGVRCAEVRAFGTLEEVDLREFDQRMRQWRPARRFQTPFTLLQLYGNLAERDGHAHVEAQVALSRDRDNGIELIGGHLVRARVYAVDFVIETFDDVVLRRSMDAGTGLALISHAFEAPSGTGTGTGTGAAIPFEAPAIGHVATTPAAVPSWAAVAAASAAVEPVEEAAPSIEPLKAGDLIDHPKFGVCEVERIEGDAEFAQVRLRNQRLVRLSLDVLEVELDATEADGRRRFRAIMPKP
jgi:predicted DNA-binding protein with PD1-like motif